VLPCPVVHEQNSRTAHGMDQLPLRSSQVPTVLHSTDHQPHSTCPPCLSGSRELLEMNLTCSEKTRKLFLIGGVCGFLANCYSPITLPEPRP